MKKDELKRQVEGTFRQFGNNDLTPYELRVRIIELLDQLDEPEVLSLDWISDNAVAGQYPDGMGYVVPAYKLQNLLVPKQEEPNDDLYILMLNGGFVTDFELEAGRVVGLERQSDYDASVVMGTRPFMEFIQKQVGGKLHNITNPEEQKYYVLLPEIVDNWRYVSLAPNHWGVTVRYTDTLDDVHEFTEQEVKDYDERYWPFAVKVEEVEG